MNKNDFNETTIIKDNNQEANKKQIFKYVMLTITFPFGFLFYGIYQLYQYVKFRQSDPEISKNKLKHSCINITVSITCIILLLLFGNYYYYNIDKTIGYGETRYEDYSRREQEKMYDIVSTITNDYLHLKLENMNLTKNGQYKNADIIFQEINDIGLITYHKFKIVIDDDWKIIKEEKSQSYQISVEMEQSIIDTCKELFLRDLFVPQTAKFANSDEWVYDISNDGKRITVTTWVNAMNLYGIEKKVYAEFDINTVSGSVILTNSWE